MSWNFSQKNKFLKKLIFKFWLWDAKYKIALIEKYLKKSDKILDIGTGPGSVCFLLIRSKLNVTPLDIKKLSLTNEVKPKIYDGKKIPFKNNSFDTALILTVLHHTTNCEEIILEAKRVAKKIIIVEDINTNTIRKYITNFLDSLANFDFFNHPPQSNKTDKKWRMLFDRLGLKLKDVQYKWFQLFFRATYYLEK